MMRTDIPGALSNLDLASLEKVHTGLCFECFVHLRPSEKQWQLPMFIVDHCGR